MLNETQKFRIPKFLIKDIQNRWDIEHPPESDSEQIKQMLVNVKNSIENGESFFANIRNKKFNFISYNCKFSIPLFTKKECHLFLNANIECNNYYKNHVANAIIYSWVLANNGSDKLFKKIISKVHVISGIFNENFYYIRYKIIRWLCKIEIEINNNFIQLRPIFDYLQFKFNNDPHYSLKGRTYKSTIKAMEIWHDQLSLEKFSKYPQNWNHSKNIQDFINDEYSITEILNVQELYKEGKELSHCVLSYIKQISELKITIWSLKMNNKKLLTIEIDEHKNVIQIRGYKNRLPILQEMLILDKWFIKEGLTKTEGNMGGF